MMTPGQRMQAEAAEATAANRAVAARELARHRQARRWLTHIEAGLERDRDGDPTGWKIAMRWLREAVALLTADERLAVFERLI